ncbi:hypothetical protein ACYU03_18215 [Pseudomonas sp. X10]
MFIMPQGRRFLGVKTVTNSDPDKGFLPAAIIRNEHWFEKSPSIWLTMLSLSCRQNLIKSSKGKGKRLECAGFPTFEHSGYAV